MVCFGIPGMKWGFGEEIDHEYVEELEDRIRHLERQLWGYKQRNKDLRAINRDLEARLMKATESTSDEDLENIFGIVVVYD